MYSTLVVTLLLPHYYDTVVTALVNSGYGVSRAALNVHDKTSPSVVMVVNVDCKDAFSRSNFTNKRDAIATILTDNGVKYYSMVLIQEQMYATKNANFSLQKATKPKPQVSYLKLVKTPEPTTQNDPSQPK